MRVERKRGKKGRRVERKGRNKTEDPAVQISEEQSRKIMHTVFCI